MANQAGPQAPIGDGQTLNADAALYWFALVAAVLALTGVRVRATEGTRTYARQLYLWVNRLKPGFNPAWHPDSPFAYHLSGRAVDVGSRVGYVAEAISKAFYGLAGDYGFRATVKGEPWHFEWRLEWVSPAIRAKIESHNLKVKAGKQTMFAVTTTHSNGRKWQAGDKFLIAGRGDISRVSSRTLDMAGIKSADITNGDMLSLCTQMWFTDSHLIAIGKR